MKVLNFKREHLEGVNLVGDEVELFKKTLDVVDHGHAATFIENGETVAFAGILVEEEVGTVWLIPTDKLTSGKIEFVRIMKAYMNNIGHVFKIKKLVTSCNGTEKIIRWLTYMGFKPAENGLYERAV